MDDTTSQRFIVSTYWSGSLTIATMRGFDTEVECWEYLKKEGHLTTIGRKDMFVRVYELFTDKPPRKCKPPKE